MTLHSSSLRTLYPEIEPFDSGMHHVGDGHTIYAMGNDCVDTAVNAYLLQDTVPAKGKRCQ